MNDSDNLNSWNLVVKELQDQFEKLTNQARSIQMIVDKQLVVD